MPGAGDALVCSAPTAKTLKERAVLVDPHFGHGIVAASSLELIVRTSFSNFVSQP
jgi:hypothetical protein